MSSSDYSDQHNRSVEDGEGDSVPYMIAASVVGWVIVIGVVCVVWWAVSWVISHFFH